MSDDTNQPTTPTPSGPSVAISAGVPAVVDDINPSTAATPPLPPTPTPTPRTPTPVGVGVAAVEAVDDDDGNESSELKSLSERVDELKSAAASAREAELKLKISKLTEGVNKYKEVVKKLHDRLKSIGDKHKAITSELAEAKAAEAEATSNVLTKASQLQQIMSSLDEVQHEMKKENDYIGPSAVSADDPGSAAVDGVERLCRLFLSRSAALSSSRTNAQETNDQLNQRIAALETQLRESEGRIASMESASATTATTRQQLEAASQSNAKMKQLILRANKHIDDNKKRMQLQSQQTKELKNHIRLLRSHFDNNWLCLPLNTSKKSAPTLTTNPTDANTNNNASTTSVGNGNNEEKVSSASSTAAAAAAAAAGSDTNTNSQQSTNSAASTATTTTATASVTGSGAVTDDDSSLLNDGEGISVDTCRIVKRVDIDGVFWLLLSVATRTSTGGATASSAAVYDIGTADDDTKATNGSQVNGDDSDSSTGSKRSAPSTPSSAGNGTGTGNGFILFWTRQEVYLRKRRQLRHKRMTEVTGATNEGMSESELTDAAKEQRDSQVVGVVTLTDGTLLPETLEGEISRRLNDKFDKRWKSNSRHFQTTLDDVQSRLTSTEAELTRVSDEYTRYKARAHGVLKQQTQELEKVNKESVEMAQLQSAFDDLKARYASLENEAKLDPQLVLSLRAEVLRLTTEKSDLMAAIEANERNMKQLQISFDINLKEATNKLQKEMNDQRDELEHSRNNIRDELISSRKKAREFLEQKDELIESLQLKVKSAQSAMTAAGGGGGGGASSPSSMSSSSRAAVASSTARALISAADGHGGNAADGSQLAMASDSASSSQLVGSSVGGAFSFPVSTSANNATTTTGQIVHLAAVQAQRDEEVHRHRLHIAKLQQLLRDQEIAQATQREKHAEVVAKLTEMERVSKRSAELMDDAKIEYLKNIVIKYMETQEHESLFPVIATVLQFSSEEIEKVKSKRSSTGRFFGLL